ncbi:GNAT family N-acetyltransferase [Streptomyces sp. NPDC055089]
MTSSATSKTPTTRITVAPPQATDHTAYFDLLDLTTAGEGIPAEARDTLTLPSAGHPFTHGPALCLAAHRRRKPHSNPVGALFASYPDWAVEHPLTKANPDLAYALQQTTILIYGVAVTPAYRRQGIARTLLTEAETRARSARYRLATLLHTPELASFYQRLGYTTAHHVTVLVPRGALGLTQPQPLMTAVKPLHPSVRVRKVHGAPGPVVTGLLPGCDLPSAATYRNGRFIV